MFTAGLLCAILWRDGPPRARPGLVALSLGTIAVAAMTTTSAAGLAPGLRDAASAHLDLAKQDLGLARVAHFAALAYLVAVAPGLTRMVEGTAGRAVQSLGRNGLAIFAAGSVLSAAGRRRSERSRPILPSALSIWPDWLTPWRASPPCSSLPAGSSAETRPPRPPAVDFDPPLRSRSDAPRGSWRHRFRRSGGAGATNVPVRPPRSMRTEPLSQSPTGGAGKPLDILAIGSSSTEGIGASTPANAYPARLEDELTHRDRIAADVKNAGVGGELAAKTLQRLKNALKSGWARLVIWQVGTNDAMVGVDEALFRATVETGVAAARAAGVPLVLIDPQVTAKSPDEARYDRFVEIVDEIGARDHVPVLSRYAMMNRRGAKGARALLSGDGLHMNDLGYRCLAHALAEAIEGAAGAKL